LAYGLDRSDVLTVAHCFGPALKALDALTIRGVL